MNDFKGTNIAAPIVPFTDGDTYPTHYSIHGKGGFKCVNTHDEMKSVPASRLETPTLCYVFENDAFYLWNGEEWIDKDMSSGEGKIQRNLRIVNNLDSKNFSASKGEPCMLKFTFISQERYSGKDPYENTGERGICQIYIRNSKNTEYALVKKININSGMQSVVDVSEFLTSGNNNVMIRVTGEVTEETTPSFVYTVQLTSLSIDASNFKWWSVFADTVYIPLNIGGNINKTLFTSISGEGYENTYEVNLGTSVYTETAYNYKLEHPGKSGVYTVSIYVANTDGTIRTRTITYNIICIVAGDEIKLIAINNILDKATNWTGNTVFEYVMYDGSNAVTSAQFLVKKENDTVFTSNEDSISVSSKHIFSLPLEIETIDDTDFSIIVKVMDGEISLTSGLVIPVNNSLGFSSVAGAVFYMNPRTRSNNQSNRQSVINEIDGTIIPASWKGMNWGSDAWNMDSDMNKVLRVMACSEVNIGYKIFALESARLGKTVEVDYKVDNVTGFNHPVISMSGSENSFVGLRIFPDNVVMYSKALKNKDNQSINLFEGQRLRLTLVIMPDAYGNSGFNLCIVYINGIKNREFTYEDNDYFAQNNDITIGSDYADVDVYGIRVYNSALTSEAVLRNYINWLSDNTEKNNVKSKNDVMDSNGSEVDFENTTDQYNVFVFDNTYPSMANPNTMKGNLGVYFAGYPEWNVSISNVESKGQGTSSMRYWKWNVRFSLDKKLSVVTHADGTTETGGWAMTPSLAKATKITAKKNFASSMQSHKIGSVNSVDDLYKAMGYSNEAMETEAYENARISVCQLPFVGFEKSINDEDKEVYTFMGLYTMGPDKGDKNTFGYDTGLFPGLLSIEGADNSPLCTLFRVPWNNKIQYNEDEESFQYNGANSWDFGAGETANISKWIPAYNIAYVCSNRLKPFNGTLEELNAQIDVYKNDPYEFWIAKEGDVNRYNVYYYEVSENRFMAADIGEGTVNLISQLVDKDYGLTASDITGKTMDEQNNLFINARIRKFRKEAPTYWDIDDAILHRNWVEFHAGTDNRAKNTYPYCFGTPASKWKWRYDDLDTIFDTDNQGQAKKEYYVEIHDKYSNEGAVWNGETSNFWNLLDLAFPEEIFSGMRKMMLAMEGLSGHKTGTDFDKLYAYFKKYYFSQSQEYFVPNLYNADARFAYENAKLAYLDGRYTNDTDPITQSLGDHYAAEQRWITKRILYMMSKYSFGLFSADGTDNITVRAAGNTIKYELVPAIDMYPAIANGTSIIRGTRTKAGEICEMLIELSGSGDQQNTIQAASYLQDIGDWHDKNVTGSMIIHGRMLRDIRLGSATGDIVISITSLTISNCTSLQNIILSNIATLRGTLNLQACTHLKKVWAGGTSLTQVVLPNGGGLELIEYSSYNQYITLKNYPLLTNEGVLIDYCKENITDFLVENSPSLYPMQLLADIIESQSAQTMHALQHIRVVGFSETYTGPQVLTFIAKLADGSYTGLNGSGLAGGDEYPVLDGTIIINSNYYQEMVDPLRNTFPKLNLVINGEPAIYFEDEEARRICCGRWDADKDGFITADEAKVNQVIEGDFSGNTTIYDLRPFSKLKCTFRYNHSPFLNCTSLKYLHFSDSWDAAYYKMCENCTSLEEIVMGNQVTNIIGYSFCNCVSLKQIKLPDSILSIGDHAFEKAGLIELDIPSSVKTIGSCIVNDCINLEKVVVRPTNLSSIGGNLAYANCPKLKALIFFQETPVGFGYGALDSKNCIFYVPDNALDAYKTASGWKGYATRIQPISSYKGEL